MVSIYFPDRGMRVGEWADKRNSVEEAVTDILDNYFEDELPPLPIWITNGSCVGETLGTVNLLKMLGFKHALVLVIIGGKMFKYEVKYVLADGVYQKTEVTQRGYQDWGQDW